MKPAADFDELVDGFKLYCRAEGKSPQTIRWYAIKLAYLKRFLTESGMPTHIGDVTTSHLRAFLVHLGSQTKSNQDDGPNGEAVRRVSPLTVAGYARGIKAFFSWLEREEYIAVSPGRLLKTPKTPYTIVRPLNSDQIRRLLDAIPRQGPAGFRDRCIVLLFLDSGLRLSELTGLKYNDVDFETAEIRVMGKGQRERIVPIGATVQQMLWKYIHHYRPSPAHPNVEFLFLDPNGYGLRPDTVYRLIAGYGKKAGLEGVRCSPHTLRHTMAKHYLMNDGDLFSLQKILGHRSLDVVRLYVELDREDIKIQHRKHSPVDLMQFGRVPGRPHRTRI